MITLAKALKFIRVVSVLYLSISLCRAGYGQIDAQLHDVDLHFEGVWVGVNHAYSKTPVVSSPVRIEIREDPKKHELRFEYTYGTKGQKGYDHLVRFMAIKPTQSTVELHWQHQPIERYLARGLDEVLKTGYGEFTCTGTAQTDVEHRPYRGTFHIEADQFTFSWEQTNDGVTYFKTGDWVLKRELAGASSIFHP